jgi:hypothetical protein
MAFTLDPQTGKITFGVVSDGTNDAISRDIASEFGVSEDFKDAFNTDNWTDQGSGFSVNTNTKVIDWDAQIDGAVNATWVDLIGSTISDTNWVLRWKYVINNLIVGAVSTVNEVHFAITDLDGTNGTNTAQDGIGFRHIIGNSASGEHNWNIYDKDGVTLPQGITGDDATFTTVPTVGTFYMELKRTSATTYEMNIYSNADYTILIEQQTGTCLATTQSLRYLKVMCRENNSGGDSTLNGTIDDVQFWDGTSVPVITLNNWRIRFKLDITNLDDGGSAVDKRLWMSMSDSDGTSGSGDAQDSLNLFTAFDTATNRFFLRDTNGSSPSGATNDATFSSGLLTVSTKYIEIKRTSDTAYEATLYSDAGFTTVIESQSGATTVGITALKYLKFMNDETISGAGAIDGTIDDITFSELVDPVAVEETFLVDALVQALGDNGCSTIFVDDFATATNWTQTGTQVTITGGEISGWGADGTAQRLTHDLVTLLNDDQWTVEFEYEFSSSTNPAHDILVLTDTDSTSSTLQDHIAVRFGFSGGLIQFGILHGKNTALGSGTILGVTASINTRYFVRLQRLSSEVARLTVFTGAFDSVLFGTIDVDLTLFGGTPTGLQFVISETSNLGGAGRILTGIIDNLSVKGCPTFSVDAILLVVTIEKTFDVNAIVVDRIDKTFVVDTFSQAGFTEDFDINALLKATQTFNFTIDGLLFITPSELICIDALIQDTFDEDFTIDTRLSALEEFTVDAGIVRIELFDVDAFAQATFDEDFTVDSRVVLRIEKTFLIDAFIQASPFIPPFAFTVDAIIRYAQGSAVGEFGAIPDLIIRVLRENGTLTGRGIVDEIVIITTAEDFPFRGKNSRIKNWLNRLRLDGLTQEDGSSPDWYKTIWSLV